jgi:alpha-L-arabinofuranosidase
MIHATLKQRHPEIVVIGTAGPFPDGEDFDQGWAFARELRVPMVDEHYYRSPDWFWGNLHRYDSYDRQSAKVYVGEYAAHEPDRRNTLRSALAEAAGGIGFENNGDVVRFASYAPLLSRRGHTQWTPDLVYFTGTQVHPSINYEVQRLLGHNRGDTLLSVVLSGNAPGERLAVSAVKDSASGDTIIKVVNGDGEPRQIHLALSSLGASRHGTWTVLTAASADATNLDGEPSQAAPRREQVEVTSAFDATFAAHSLTVIRFR